MPKKGWDYLNYDDVNETFNSEMMEAGAIKIPMVVVRFMDQTIAVHIMTRTMMTITMNIHQVQYPLMRV